MASYNGTVILSGMISPTDTTDAYPTHEDILGKGGFMSVNDTSERDNIPMLRRKGGMLVYVASEDTTYQLLGGIDNIHWVDFKTQTGSGGEVNAETLQQTEISVTGFINTIFEGIHIPDDEILYVRGNDSDINSVVYHGVLESVLLNNVYNDFLIVYNGTSSFIYVNNVVDEAHVQGVVNQYPKGYDLINTDITPVSTKITNLLTVSHTVDLIVYSNRGIMSKMTECISSFEVLSGHDDIIIIYDGSTFSTYKRVNVTITELQAKKILV